MQMTYNNLVAMQYLTVAAYAKLKGISRQAVYQQIQRKTLPLVTIKEEVQRIPVDDIELKSVKPKRSSKR